MNRETATNSLGRRNLSAFAVARVEPRAGPNALDLGMDETPSTLLCAIESELDAGRARIENEHDALTGICGAGSISARPMEPVFSETMRSTLTWVKPHGGWSLKVCSCFLMKVVTGGLMAAPKRSVVVVESADKPYGQLRGSNVSADLYGPAHSGRWH